MKIPKFGYDRNVSRGKAADQKSMPHMRAAAYFIGVASLALLASAGVPYLFAAPQKLLD